MRCCFVLQIFVEEFVLHEIFSRCRMITDARQHHNNNSLFLVVQINRCLKEKNWIIFKLNCIYLRYILLIWIEIFKKTHLTIHAG